MYQKDQKLVNKSKDDPASVFTFMLVCPYKFAVFANIHAFAAYYLSIYFVEIQEIWFC